MKKLVPLFMGFLLGFSNPTAAKTTTYNEKNIGACLGGDWCQGGFPGASYLRVKTKTDGKHSRNFNMELHFQRY